MNNTNEFLLDMHEQNVRELVELEHLFGSDVWGDDEIQRQKEFIAESRQEILNRMRKEKQNDLPRID